MLAVACLILNGSRATAQSTTSLQTDATVLPRRAIGIRGLISFARYDALLGNGGTRNIAASLTTDSLSGADFSQFANEEALLRTLTGSNAFAIKAGQIVAAANSRVVTAPVILEYGLTSKLTLGVAVPLVETRTTVSAQLNKTLALANVGLNPGSATNWSTNATLVSGLRGAAAALQAQLASCQANPSAAGCAALLAQQSTAMALIASTTPFANALESVYGTGQSLPGLSFVPVTGTAAQLTINDRLDALRAQYQQFSQTVAGGFPSSAPTQAGHDGLQSLLALAGYDTLQAIDRTSLGDISIGATYQLANTFTDSAHANVPGLLYRISLNATARIGTGEPSSRNKLFDNPTGYGQPGAILGAATDIRFTPRVYLTALGSYMKQLGTIDVARPANAGNAILPLSLGAVAATYSAGDEIALTLMPRYRIAGLFSIDGIYSLKHVAAESYEYANATPSSAAFVAPIPPFGAASATGHVVGFGLTYSSSLTDRGPGRLPYEASFRHTETIAASGGPMNKTFVDQIQLRIFVR